MYRLSEKVCYRTTLARIFGRVVFRSRTDAPTIVTTVCGRFRDTRSWSDLHRALVAASLPVAEQPALNLEPRVQVRPTNDVTIVRLENG